jgi:protein TonB
MAKPLLYKPPPNWQFWAYVGAAVLIHAGAVGIAALPKHEPAIDLSQIPTAEVTATLEQQPEATPPPEDIPLPPPPPVPEVQTEFHEEATPPPRQRVVTAVKAPIKAPSVSLSTASTVFKVKPDYPYEARSRHLTGSGVCVLTVDTPSGNVTDAMMAQSIGSPILDNATITAFRRWKFKPGAYSKVKVPITFTMTGASY